MKRFWIAIIGVAYALLLHAVYLEWIVVHFAYEGYMANSRGVFPLAVTLTLVVIPLLILPEMAYPWRLPSRTVFILLYVLTYVPTLIYLHNAAVFSSLRTLFFEILLATSFSLLAAVGRVPIREFRPLLIDRRVVTAALLIASALLYLVLLATTGFSIRVAGIQDAYSVRDEYSTLLANAPARLAYFIDWQMNAVNPLLLAIGVIDRRRALIAAALAGQLLIFFVTGLKSILFVLPLVAIIGYRVSRGRAVDWFIVIATTCVVGVALFIDTWTGGLLVSSYAVRRPLFLSAMIAGNYLDFFSTHPLALYGHSFLRGFVDYPYAFEPPHLIGQEYFADSGVGANGNFLADAFANLGVLGVIAITLLLCAVLWAVDCTAKWNAPAILSAILCVHAVTLSNSGFLTTLVSHGLALTLFFAAIGFCATSRAAQACGGRQPGRETAGPAEDDAI